MMKKVLIVAATAGLMTLAAACTPTANNTVDANADVANAQAYDDAANVTDENATTPVVDNETAGNTM